jgi:hypothetical protein
LWNVLGIVALLVDGPTGVAGFSLRENDGRVEVAAVEEAVKALAYIAVPVTKQGAMLREMRPGGGQIVLQRTKV